VIRVSLVRKGTEEEKTSLKVNAETGPLLEGRRGGRKRAEARRKEKEPVHSLRKEGG